MKVCVVGASGKLGRYMVQHALDRGYEVVGVCRAESVGKLDSFQGRIKVVPGATDDREVIRRARGSSPRAVAHAGGTGAQGGQGLDGALCSRVHRVRRR